MFALCFCVYFFLTTVYRWFSFFCVSILAVVNLIVSSGSVNYLESFLFKTLFTTVQMLNVTVLCSVERTATAK